VSITRDPVADIVEVFWNARPHLARAGIKVGAAALDPRAERLFGDVRAAAAEGFPGSVTLVRIVTRKDPDIDLRATRAGACVPEREVAALRALVDAAIEAALAPEPDPAS
jgi:hypothetical protein